MNAPSPRQPWSTPRLKTSPGAAPGTLIVDEKAAKPEIDIHAYDPDGVEHAKLDSPQQIRDWLGRHSVVWINVVGLGDVALLQEIGDLMNVHRLALEDVVNVHQRPKVEDYDDHLFIITRMPHEADVMDTEQVSMLLGPGYLLTLQERPGDCLAQVRQRLIKGKGKMRRAGSDYLAYAILDAVTDAYFPIMERYGEKLEQIEEETLTRPDLDTMGKIHHAKRDLLVVRRIIWPMREMLGSLYRDESELVHESTRVYIRDCYDHAVQLIDVLENYREIASGLTDIYMSSIGQRMNEIMKVLTIIATIFIPLTFIAGIYGMNFDTEKSPLNLPELGWYYGYPACLLAMVVTGIGMLVYFRRIGWIGKSP